MLPQSPRHRPWLLSALLLGAAVAPTAAQVDLSTLEGMPARGIGPTGMSGRIGAIDAVARNPNIIYAGAATGGLWKSTTGGVTWTPLMDDLRAPSIGDIAIYQPVPDIVWVGTGERNRRNSAGVGTGMYKTLDGGTTWTAIGLEGTEAIDAIQLHPNDPDIAYVGALGPTWRESEDRGVYKTVDGGRTWEKILYINETTGAGDLVMDPSNPDHLLASMWQHRRWPWFFTSGGPGSGLYQTWDGGETWTKLTPDDGLPAGELGRIGLAFAPSEPDIVYALVEAKKSVLLRSEDGGKSWITVNRSEGIAPRPFYYQQLRVDPEHPYRVYNVESRIQLSIDGGEHFETLLRFDNRVHIDFHAWWINPYDGRTIINGNDGGVYISQDRGMTWRFVENLPLAQFYHMNVDMATPFNVYGGLQDNGSWQGPSSVWENGGIRYYHWKEVAFGDGFATLNDPTDDRYGYAMSQGGNLVRFDKLTGQRQSIRPPHPDGVPLRFNWNAGIAIDPFDQSIYYGSQFVHRTADQGRSWTILSPDLTTNDPAKQEYDRSGGLTFDASAAENHTTILTIAPSPVERGVLWVGTDDGNVQITRDGGATWENVVGRIRGVPEATWVPHIEPSKFDGGTAWVVFDNHRRSDGTAYLYRTTNYGRSWESLVTPDLDGFLHVIEQDPVNPDLLFAGGEFGLYVSFDAGESWGVWTHGVPRAPVRALIVHPRDHDLVIGTHGRSTFILDDVRPLRALADDPAVASAPLTLFPIPPTIQYQVAQVDGMRFIGDAKFEGENRPYGALLSYMVNTEDDSVRVRFAVTRNDEPVRTFSRWATPGLNRTTWNLREDGLPAGDADADDDPPSGPYVLAGTYTVTAATGADTSAQTVDVAFDPRFEISLADRQAKIDAQRHIGQRIAVARETQRRLREAKQAASTVLDRLDADDETHTPLRESATAVRDGVDSLLVAFSGPEGLQGFVRTPNTVMAALFGAGGPLNSSWGRPTPSEGIFLAQAEARLREVLADVEAFANETYNPFRDEARSLEVDLPARFETPAMDWRPDA